MSLKTVYVQEGDLGLLDDAGSGHVGGGGGLGGCLGEGEGGCMDVYVDMYV